MHFALTDCDPCPLRPRCTKAANGKWGRSLTLEPREQQQILEQRRTKQQTDAWKQRYDTRAGVEGTISQAIRRTGIRRTRYTGLPKTRLGNVLAAAAINLIRLDAWLTGTPLGKTRTSHLPASNSPLETANTQPFCGFPNGVLKAREESLLWIVLTRSLARAFLLLDVFLDDAEWRSATRCREVRRGPEVWAPQVFAGVVGEFLSESACGHSL